MRKLQVFLMAVAVALGLAAAGGTANAWPWDSHVTVYGSLNQCTNNGIQTARVNAVLNGERHIQNTAAGQPPSYSVTFSNVPSGFGWAWIVVDCAVVGGSQGHWVKVTRPAFGTSLRADL